MRVARLCAGLVAAAVAGCSPGGSSLHTVTGRVTFENEPVKTGRITFKMNDAGGKAYSAEIADGAYTAQVEAGTAVVEITGSRLIPGKFDTSNGTKEPVGEMYIPGKYNASTQLKVEVKAGSNDIPFDLKK